MAFLDKTGLQTLTNKLVQGDAIKVASHRGRTIENVIDNITRECTNVPTPLEYKIENRVADFRIGQGRDVDASGDVETGYSEIGLQGKTWQNLCATSETSQIFDVDGAKVLIQLLKASDRNMFKANTTYTVILDFTLDNYISKNELSMVYLEATCSNSEKPTIFIPIHGTRQFRADGKYFTVVKFTTISDMTQMNSFYLAVKDCSGSLKLNSSIILEGDHTQTPAEELPRYFEGIQSSFEDGVVDIDVVGKNKIEFPYFHKSKTEQGVTFNVNDDGSISLSGVADANVDFLLKESEKWILPIGEYCYNLLGGSDKKIHYVINGGYSGITYREGVKGTFRVKIENKSCGHLRIRVLKGTDCSNIVLFPLIYPINLLSKYEVFEPYYKKKISFNIDEPLRSLPNGVCDEIKAGNLIRRVGKVVLDGSESWDIAGVTPFTNSKFQDVKINSVNCMICDKFKYSYGSSTAEDFTCWWGGGEINKNKNFVVTVPKEQQSVVGIKEWLQANPTTVLYELATPIITPIDPIKFETQPLGSIEINSEISPTSFHTVQLNRAAQIERGITEIAELKNRVEILETMYDSHFLETAHKLELLGMDYELESEEF